MRYYRNETGKVFGVDQDQDFLIQDDWVQLSEEEKQSHVNPPIDHSFLLRAKRNQLLAETDYLALADHTLSADMTAYRQALRDLPANTTDPANPVWPTKPGGSS